MKSGKETALAKGEAVKLFTKKQKSVTTLFEGSKVNKYLDIIRFVFHCSSGKVECIKIMFPRGIRES